MSTENAMYRTDEGIEIQPVYTSADLEGWEEKTALGAPGELPFTRGIYPRMYRERPWTIRQLAGFGSARDTNGRLRLLLEQGATGVNCVFDYPTNRGYDSDLPLAEGDVGQGGVAVDTLADMQALFDGIPLDRMSVSLVLSHPVGAGAILAMYFAAAAARGYRVEHLSGTLQNDFMMETVVLTAPNTLEPRFSFRLSMDVVEHCLQHAPRWNPISYTGYNYREAGANAVQEIALTFANALETVRELKRRGHAVDAVAPRLSFFFSAGNDLFAEAAKFRAARRLYARLMTEQLGARVPRSGMLRFHVQTAGSALTAQQPLNNITRAAYHALAAVLGGTQSLHVSAFDEALCVPSEEAALTALRVQQILLEETRVAQTVDPLAGSYYVERLTDELEEQIAGYLSQIEVQGGLVAAVERGWVHAQILDNAYRRELELAVGTRRQVGVNCYKLEESVTTPVFQVPPTRAAQVANLERWRGARDGKAAAEALSGLRRAVERGENTMPGLLDAVRAGATLGECAEVFRTMGGGWRQPLF